MDTLGDEFADAVILDFSRASPEERALLTRGMVDGSRHIPEAPESFRRFIADAEAAADACPPETLQQASETYLTVGPTWLTLSLGPGALVHTYSDPGIAAVLTKTGNLLGQITARRLLETQLWNIQVVRPGGLSKGGAGYVQTRQVRLLHAKVRAALKNNSEFEHSTAIDQRQMVRTWLDFTLVSFDALEKAGFAFTPQQMTSVYEMWRLIGRLLGIAPQPLALIGNAQAAAALLRDIDRVAQPPDDNSRKLTQAMLDVIGARIAGIFGLPSDVSRLLADSFCRLFYGDELASLLNIPENWTVSLLPLFQNANRGRIAEALADQARHKMLLDQTRSDFDAIEKAMSDPATFRKTTEILSRAALPTVGRT